MSDEDQYQDGEWRWWTIFNIWHGCWCDVSVELVQRCWFNDDTILTFTIFSGKVLLLQWWWSDYIVMMMWFWRNDVDTICDVEQPFSISQWESFVVAMMMMRFYCNDFDAVMLMWWWCFVNLFLFFSEKVLLLWWWR